MTLPQQTQFMTKSGKHVTVFAYQAPDDKRIRTAYAWHSKPYPEDETEAKKLIKEWLQGIGINGGRLREVLRVENPNYRPAKESVQ